MVDPSKSGTDWQDDELDAVVATYFDMLLRPGSDRGWKSDRILALDAEIARGANSIGRKLSNISYVAHDALGLPKLPGFGALPNVQRAIFPAIERFLASHEDAWDAGMDRVRNAQALSPISASVGLAETPRLFVRDEIQVFLPPILGERESGQERMRQLVRKFDPASRDARNRVLGRAGEEKALSYEIDRLIGLDRMDLAKRVEWTADVHGDGAGYDIRSFDEDGRERFIEVKTTRGGPRTDFFLSRNERAFSEEEPERYRLYRLYDASAALKLFELRPPLEQAVRLQTETWRAGFD